MLARLSKIALPLALLAASPGLRAEEHKSAESDKAPAHAAAEQASATERAPAAERPAKAEHAAPVERTAHPRKAASEHAAAAEAAADEKDGAAPTPRKPRLNPTLPVHQTHPTPPPSLSHPTAKPKWARVGRAQAIKTAERPVHPEAPVAVATPVTLAALPVAATSLHAENGRAPHWTYEGATGPTAWAQLSAEYATCANGARQSPIDIREGIKLELEPVVFEYRSSGFQVVDNGHTIQANIQPGNYIRVMGRRFQLLQFHFHRPSEELIDGRPSEMVAHLVHKDQDGKLAVVAVLIDRGTTKQPAIQSVWNNLPLEKNEEVAASTRIDPTQLLPENRRYYAYMGSLTTPPCTEGVLWIVMKQPMMATSEQIDLFARLYPMNARPVQATAGRLIKESN